MNLIDSKILKDYLERDKAINGLGSVDRLAGLVNISPGRIRAMRRNEDHHTLRIDRAFALAKALKVDIYRLYNLER